MRGLRVAGATVRGQPAEPRQGRGEEELQRLEGDTGLDGDPGRRVEARHLRRRVQAAGVHRIAVLEPHLDLPVDQRGDRGLAAADALVADEAAHPEAQRDEGLALPPEGDGSGAIADFERDDQAAALGEALRYRRPQAPHLS